MANNSLQEKNWWKEGIVYQIYPRSYKDTLRPCMVLIWIGDYVLACFQKIKIVKYKVTI